MSINQTILRARLARLLTDKRKCCFFTRSLCYSFAHIFLNKDKNESPKRSRSFYGKNKNKKNDGDKRNQERRKCSVCFGQVLKKQRNISK